MLCHYNLYCTVFCAAKYMSLGWVVHQYRTVHCTLLQSTGVHCPVYTTMLTSVQIYRTTLQWTLAWSTFVLFHKLAAWWSYTKLLLKLLSVTAILVYISLSITVSLQAEVSVFSSLYIDRAIQRKSTYITVNWHQTVCALVSTLLQFWLTGGVVKNGNFLAKFY